nr:uncharacterized protein C5orf49 homolog [Columba livia]
METPFVQESHRKDEVLHREDALTQRQEMFPLTMPFLIDQRVTTKNFTDVTENMQAVVVLTLTRSVTLKGDGLHPPQVTHFLEAEKKQPLQEMARPVAVLSSSEYGRRVHKPLEQPIREHVKIDRLQAELYRTNGVTCLMGKPPSSLEPF